MLGHHTISEAPLSSLPSGFDTQLNEDALFVDAISFAILRNRGWTDSLQFSDRILSTIATYDSVFINRAKPISRPRWLFDANIGGTRRFSSEDLEKP